MKYMYHPLVYSDLNYSMIGKFYQLTQIYFFDGKSC